MSDSGAGPQPGMVSVVIPTWRRPAEVRRAAESALAQGWTALEVVVVSDGPDQATAEALEPLLPGGWLRYLELHAQAGPAAACNAGVRASRGEWLSFLDDDDLMLPGKIDRQMALADAREPKRMVSCRTVYRRVDAQGVREDVWSARPLADGEDLAEYLLRRPSLLGRPGVLPIQTLLVHRSVLEQRPFVTEADHEDWGWLLEAWRQDGVRAVFAWEPLVVYNVDPEGASRSRRVNWGESLRWAEAHREAIGNRAMESFLATKVAFKARRAGDWRSAKGGGEGLGRRAGMAGGAVSPRGIRAAAGVAGCGVAAVATGVTMRQGAYGKGIHEAVDAFAICQPIAALSLTAPAPCRASW